MSKIAIAAVLALIGSAFSNAPASASEKVFNLPEIALKQQSDVRKVLGSPSKCEKIKQGEKCYFQKGLVEIVFIEGKADWITVNYDNFPYGPDALPMIGLEKSKPTVSNNFVVSWNGVTHTTEEDASGATKFVTLALIQMNAGAPGRADGVYVKAATK
ncbi:hypothetical protein ACIU1J_01805 [Azospirillum doebereinerae]|uniref:hypothetical protein n=1 Tax=Azospirillum doebereinerae TaxID=92933 RepID=UPI001EE5839E|nr:hypothetical protein [Azospirillum doebereinerae]MCG5240066.1 hypothetical protein [Azospirillum doebereinerae]